MMLISFPFVFFSFLFVRIKMIKGKTKDKVISRCLIHNQHSCKTRGYNTVKKKKKDNHRRTIIRRVMQILLLQEVFFTEVFLKSNSKEAWMP